MFTRKALLDNGTRSNVISCILNTFLRIGGGWHIVRSRSIKTDLIICASTRMSTIGVPSVQISREEMKSDPLRFLLHHFILGFPIIIIDPMVHEPILAKWNEFKYLPKKKMGIIAPSNLRQII